MKAAVSRIKQTFAQRTGKTAAVRLASARMSPAQERRVRDELSDFVADLLARRAAQLSKFRSLRPGPPPDRPAGRRGRIH